jgi:hypothetical protein
MSRIFRVILMYRRHKPVDIIHKRQVNLNLFLKVQNQMSPAMSQFIRAHQSVCLLHRGHYFF